jgi:ribonuclease Z
MNGVPPATVIHQFFPQPAYQVLDALQADTDSELVFLGTAAASPSKLRNGACAVWCGVCCVSCRACLSPILTQTHHRTRCAVSSIYLHLASGGVIMDAGEGTYNQLLQRYGRADIDRVIRGLRLCFISHMHGDHLIGLVSLLLHRTELDLLRLADTANDADADDKIVLVAPLDVHRMLEAYNRSCPVPLVYDFVECRHVHYARGLCDATGLQEVPGGRALARTMEALGLARVETAEVIHACNSGARAHAIALTSRDVGWKIVYSGTVPAYADVITLGWWVWLRWLLMVLSGGGAGDTLQPCQELIELGMGATVLIHEASFAQDKAREARRKFHSTSEDAIEAGAQRTAHTAHTYMHTTKSTTAHARHTQG